MVAGQKNLVRLLTAVSSMKYVKITKIQQCEAHAMSSGPECGDIIM